MQISAEVLTPSRFNGGQQFPGHESTTSLNQKVKQGGPLNAPPPLLRHGEHIKPHYVSGWAGKSVDAERPDGNATGIVRRFDRRWPADSKPMSQGFLAAVSEEAVRYTTPAADGLMGLVQVVGLLMAGAGVFLSTMMFDVYEWPPRTILDPPLWLGPPVLLASFLLVWLWTLRLGFFQPIDQPTIFDRKRRKVYRLFSEVQPGVKGLFQPWPLRACEYEWDLIDAEHNAQMVTTGSTVRRDCRLIFIVRKSADDPTIIDSFNIGGQMVLDETVAATYEHIRRFMEDGGPPVPPGESPPQPRAHKGFWARVWQFSPLNIKGYLWAWREELPMMLLAHVLFPLTIVFGGLWLFFNWLSLRTSRPIEWPAELVAAVGPVVAARQSAADMA